MYKSKLYQVLAQFDKKEIKRLDLFLNSPFFNQDRRIILYFNEIKTSLVSKEQLDKKLLFNHLFPNKSYDDTLLRVLQSQFLKLVEKFIFHNQSSENDFESTFQLLEYYRIRQLWKPYTTHLKKIATHFASNSIGDESHIWYRYKYMTEKINLEAFNKTIKPDSLQNYYNSVSDVHLTALLKSACRLLTEESVYNYTFDIGTLNTLAGWIKTHEQNLSPIVRVYFAYYQMLEDPSAEEHYQTFVQLLAQHNSIFPKKELRDLYLVANNYCIKRVNQGDKKYENLALKNYKDALEEEVLFENGLLSQRTYNNIVALALKNNQWDWVEDFMDKYTQSLRSSEQESTYHLNKARLSYVKQDFDQALELLQGADFKPMLNNLSAKTLMIKLFYETEEYDVLYYQLKAMRAFLYRNKVMGYHKKAFNNLIRYTEKLLRIHSGDKQKIEKVKSSIEDEEIIWEKEWLLTQLEKKGK